LINQVFQKFSSALYAVWYLLTELAISCAISASPINPIAGVCAAELPSLNQAGTCFNNISLPQLSMDAVAQILSLFTFKKLPAKDIAQPQPA
tara:strand:- start:210 stop:485 length:276 start_codon:yes stop_codon:yes gene_type:complete